MQGTTLPCSLCARKFLGVISKYVVKHSKNLVNCLYMCTYKIPVYLRLFICTYWQVSGIFHSCIIYIFYSQRNRSSGAVTLCEATACKEPKLFPQSTFWGSTVKKAEVTLSLCCYDWVWVHCSLIT